MTYEIFPGKKIFPIKTDTACLLKWAWSTINLGTGKTSSCHRTEPYKIDPENFQDFHNLPEKIQAREKMLQGQWPGHGCEYCKNVEMNGGMSDRLMTLERSHGLDKIPPELLVDPTATSVTPIILEVYFNNTCNLSCVYCDPVLSSKWNDEIRKYGDIEIGNFKKTFHIASNDRYQRMISDFWSYLETDQRYKIIRHFQLLGGESLLQQELDQSLDFWEHHKNSSLTFNMITNMMLPHKKFVEKMQRFEYLVKTESILQLELTASLDCWGPQQEYVRWGLDLETWQQNFEWMLDKPWCKLAIHSCISSLTIKTLPELIEKINHWNKKRSPENFIEHSFDLVVGEPQKVNGMHPTVFGGGVFDEDFSRVIDLMPVDTETQKTARQQMQGQALFVKNSVKNTERIKTLQAFLDELDRRRKCDWRTLFPWLDRDWDLVS